MEFYIIMFGFFCLFFFFFFFFCIFFFFFFFFFFLSFKGQVNNFFRRGDETIHGLIQYLFYLVSKCTILY